MVADIGAQFAELRSILFAGLVVWSLVFGRAMVLIALRLRAERSTVVAARRAPEDRPSGWKAG